MRWYNTLVCIFVEVFGIVLNIVNSFAANIVVYEVTNGLRFNRNLLLKNKIFWIIIFAQIIYGVASVYVNRKNQKSDARLKKAIEDHEISLFSQVVDYSSQKDFDSAVKVFEILDEFERRRNK